MGGNKNLEFYLCGRCCICSRRSKSISDWGVWCGTPLDVVGDNHFPAPICVQQWDIVVLDRHVVLLVLAGLGTCGGYMCVCGA